MNLKNEVYFDDNTEFTDNISSVQTIIKATSSTAFFKTSTYFSSPLNKIVQGICNPYPSPKLTHFPVTIILAVFIGLAREK